MMPRGQTTKSLHYSGTISEIALRSEDASTEVAPMLSTIQSSPPSEEFISAQDNIGNWSSLVFVFSYTSTTDHP